MAESGPAAEFRPVELGGKNLPISDDPKDTASKKEQEPSSSQNAVPPYLMRKFFVARPGAFEQANEDLRNQILTKENETVNSAWLLAEVDHWNNEKERLVLITDKSLFICKYDFIMLCCQQIQKVPLNFIDKLCLGPFTFPERSLDKREGEGLRVHWDKLREPTFANRWNPFSEVLPYTTFIDHPLKSSSEKFSVICQVFCWPSHTIPWPIAELIKGNLKHPPASHHYACPLDASPVDCRQPPPYTILLPPVAPKAPAYLYFWSCCLFMDKTGSWARSWAVFLVLPTA
ncbi:tumor protein p63-regulated gene 1 protein isoform X1 [Xenopus tropicalis]|uniref:Tumor protein p63 regulated 1 n=1 Tax=Xenopus tropicalis TaxID=8364 RepID=A0A6I8Q1V5_XENTR|nr:tumor protein p63-regulated gene 1 protein isoform X1 [Xenopus tropicalis]